MRTGLQPERGRGKANMYAGQNVSLAPSLPRRLCCWIEHAGFNLDTSWVAQLTPIQPYVIWNDHTLVILGMFSPASQIAPKTPWKGTCLTLESERKTRNLPPC